MNFCLVVGCFAIFLALASCVGNERQPERKEKRVSNRRVAVVANATAVGPTNITVNATEAEKSKENVTELLKDDKNATQGNVTETPDIMVAAENKTKENSVTDPPAPNLVVGALAAPPLEGYEEPVKELGTDEEIVNDYVPEFETEPHIPTSNENENILGRQSSVRKYFAVERREPNPEEIVMIPPEKAGVHRKRTPTPKRILKETNAPRVRLIPPARRSHSQQRQDYIVQQRIHRSRDKDLQARKELALMKLVRGRNYQIKEATPVYRETIFMESYNRPDIKNTIILATRHEKKKGQAEDAGSRIYLANQLSPRELKSSYCEDLPNGNYPNPGLVADIDARCSYISCSNKQTFLFHCSHGSWNGDDPQTYHGGEATGDVMRWKKGDVIFMGPTDANVFCHVNSKKAIEICNKPVNPDH